MLPAAHLFVSRIRLTSNPTGRPRMDIESSTEIHQSMRRRLLPRICSPEWESAPGVGASTHDEEPEDPDGVDGSKSGRTLRPLLVDDSTGYFFRIVSKESSAVRTRRDRKVLFGERRSAIAPSEISGIAPSRQCTQSKTNIGRLLLIRSVSGNQIP
jgi:hypothetical protein